MTDIDFDELDKAVNSLMNKNQDRANTAAGADDVDAQSKKSFSFSEDNSNSSLEPSMLQEPIIEPTSFAAPTPSSPQIRRSTGRFMDVVLPQSAVKADDSSMRKMKPRDRATLQPVVDSFSAPAPEEVAQVVDEPIDGTNIEPEVDSLSSFNLSAAPMPMNSPFLNNVEVNKRPLGTLGESGDATLAAVEEVDSQSVDHQNESDSPENQHQFMANGGMGAEIDLEAAAIDDAALNTNFPEFNQDELPTDPEVEAHQEFSQWEPSLDQDSEVDLTQQVVENLEQEFAHELAADNSEPTVEEVSTQEKDDLESDELFPEEEIVNDFDKSDQFAVDQDAPESEPESELDLDPETDQQVDDILPQYTPEVTNPPEPSSVFEAASESPKELEHPEKARSGWMVLVWIVILIILGAAGGVGAWYFLIK